MNEDSNNSIILFIFVLIFIVTYWFISHFFTARKKKIYDQALKEHSTVEAKSIKMHLIDPEHKLGEWHDYRNAVYQHIYEYTVQGKKYKKKINYNESQGKPVITLYYDQQHPRRAVTATEATQSSKITPVIIAFFTMLIVGNIVIRMLGLL